MKRCPSASVIRICAPGWGRSRRTMRFDHYCEHPGAEVDALLETTDGRIAAIGINATATVRAKNIRRLKQMQDRLGPSSIGGLILYSGSHGLGGRSRTC